MVSDFERRLRGVAGELHRIEIEFRRGCLHIPFEFGFLLAVFVTFPGESSKSLWDRQQPPLARLTHSRSAVACKAHERRRNPPQVSGRP